MASSGVTIDMIFLGILRRLIMCFIIITTQVLIMLRFNMHSGKVRGWICMRAIRFQPLGGGGNEG
jgi:hypothetical protein